MYTHIGCIIRVYLRAHESYQILSSADLESVRIKHTREQRAGSCARVQGSLSGCGNALGVERKRNKTQRYAQRAI